MEPFSQPTNQRCSGNCNHVCAISRAPAQVSSSIFPAPQSISTESSIYCLDLFSGLNIVFSPDLLVDNLKLKHFSRRDARYTFHRVIFRWISNSNNPVRSVFRVFWELLPWSYGLKKVNSHLYYEAMLCSLCNCHLITVPKSTIVLKL